jgi:type VI secretion system protein ImpK
MKSIIEKNRLADICHELIDMILKMRIKNDFGNILDFQNNINSSLIQIEHDTENNDISSQEFENAKFALVAFIDEMVITSDWAEKESWVADPLQMKLYNRFDAGEEFFRRLNSLKINSTQHRDSLEVYYLCLGLGFKGKFAMDQQRSLEAIVKNCYEEFIKKTGSESNQLSPFPLPLQDDRGTDKSKIPIKYIGLGVFGLVVLFYIIITFVSINAAENSIINIF